MLIQEDQQKYIASFSVSYQVMLYTLNIRKMSYVKESHTYCNILERIRRKLALIVVHKKTLCQATASLTIHYYYKIKYYW